MHRHNKNEGERFSAALDSTIKEAEASLCLRRKEMAQAWDDLDKGWQDLRNRMAEVGITKPVASDERIAWLNVGGSLVNVHYSVFEGKRGSSVAPWALADLFVSVWDKRLPRDSEGRTVLDESPACIKHLVHSRLQSPGEDGGLDEALHEYALADDEKPNLSYVFRALGPQEPAIGMTESGRSTVEASVAGMTVTGGSTVLDANNVNRLTATIQGWFPTQPNEMTLLYRASRDGWTPDAFDARCGADSPSTITLIRVQSEGSESRDSIVGGFSNIPWSGGTFRSRACDSPGAFLFMLEDGRMSRMAPFQPVKWHVFLNHLNVAVIVSARHGPAFGRGDLRVEWLNTPPTLGVYRFSYPVSGDFVRCNKRPIVEIETFRVSSTATTTPPLPTKPACRTTAVVADPALFPSSTASTKEHSDDIQKFGEMIAASLLEERTALREAHIELVEADVKATASANALAAVYGPNIAVGKEDPVVELSVRGSRVTTLLSTLQVCPESFLAIKFNENRWPATDKDVDQHGRRLIDCRPSVFAKVLDVLRMRKRAGWSRTASSHRGRDNIGRIIVKADDRDAFEEFVEKHFPGDLQSFIMDCVERNPVPADY